MRLNKITKRESKDRKQGDLFTSLCLSLLKVECEKEYKFHTIRKWRFDYAIPKYKIAIEIDGGIWTYGRHNRARGYIADMEKFNEAAKLGWVVLKFTPQEQHKLATFNAIKAAINTAKERIENVLKESANRSKNQEIMKNQAFLSDKIDKNA